MVNSLYIPLRSNKTLQRGAKKSVKIKGFEYGEKIFLQYTGGIFVKDFKKIPFCPILSIFDCVSGKNLMHCIFIKTSHQKICQHHMYIFLNVSDFRFHKH